MNRTEYLEALNKRLKLIPREDREDAINYYYEFIGECDPSGELDVVQILGTPKEVANKIIDECTIRYSEDQTEEQYDATGEKKSVKKKVKGSATTIWLAILGAASLPVAFPITIVTLLLVLTAITLLITVVLTVGIAGIAACLCGGFFIISSIFMGPLGQILVNIGTGAAAFGIGMLLIIGAFLIIRGTVRLIGHTANSRRQRRTKALS